MKQIINMFSIRTIFTLLLSGLMLTLPLSGQDEDTKASTCGSFRAVHAESPVTPDAMPQVQALLDFFMEIKGKSILAGQQESVAWDGINNEKEMEFLLNLTGKLPAVRGFDFIFYSFSEESRKGQRVADRAVEWARKGGVVTIAFHWNAGSEDQQNFRPNLTDFDLEKALIPGTPDYAEFIVEMDMVAEELKILRDAGVPVLWRPFHECSGRWFWWGSRGPDVFKQAWRFMFDRFTQRHGLNNLIWVYNPTDGVGLLESWFPGDAYVDMVGLDIYPERGLHPVYADAYRHFQDFMGCNRAVALTENGSIPDPDKVFDEALGWVYFCTWDRDHIMDGLTNPADFLKRVYNHPSVITLDEMPEVYGRKTAPMGDIVELKFLRAPVNQALNPLVGQDVAVALRDHNGRTVRTEERIIDLYASSGHTIEKIASARTLRGIAVFKDVKIPRAGEGVHFIAVKQGDSPRDSDCSAISSPFQVGPGSGAVAEFWFGIEGYSVEDFVDHPKFKQKPDNTLRLTQGFSTPAGLGENFGGRIRAIVIPPETGNYIFWTSSDDHSALFFHAADKPEDRKKIASLRGYSFSGQWDKEPSQRSEAIFLEKGKQYILEAFYKDATGGDFLAVGWQLPNGELERPIPAFRLLPAK